MTLSDWLANGWLREHETTREEIAAFFAVVERDLADCRVPLLSSDARLAIAYNAALQLALAGLAAAGYRPGRERHHELAIQSLAHTVGADAKTIDALDRFRRKRNRGTYERAGTVSEAEADRMRELAEDLHVRVKAWLRMQHGNLL